MMYQCNKTSSPNHKNMAMGITTNDILQHLPSQTVTITIALGLFVLILLTRFFKKPSTNSPLPSLPAVPGLPLIGNLHQLSDKKPHHTFTKWAEIYGPIYSIKTGYSTLVVLNSNDVAKEAMVTRFSSISTRKLSNALKILTLDKKIVAISDYGDFHKITKKYLITGMLGANAQKRYRCHRETMMSNMMRKFDAHNKEKPLESVNFRSIFQHELFGLALKQAYGGDLEASVYIEGLGTKLSRYEIFEALVVDPMMGAIAVDWRDFFPYLRWIPNKGLEARIERMAFRRRAVGKALLDAQKRRRASGEILDSYVDYLLAPDIKQFSEDELIMLMWEVIIETSDTTLVTTEWAMYEIAKNRGVQELLYRELKEVCGSEKVTEDHLPRLPYLNAIFHETLRRHSPAPMIPLRYVHEDTELGGYHIPAGTEISINIYGCNMDKKQWDEPEAWKPERFLDPKFDPTDMFKSLAFGGGKRICAGAQQAMTIACMAIATFVQEFDWKLDEGQKEDVNTLGLTSYRLYPLLVHLQPRRA